MTSASPLRNHWPGVWKADELAPAVGEVVASGHAALDAELPGGGWPLGGLVDLLAATPATPWSALLLSALARQTRARKGALALVQPPHEPYLPALAAAGLPPQGVLWLRARAPAEQLWLTEQALGCADFAAVLAWLPRTRPADLRRLHLAAARRADVLFFAFRQAATGAAACAPLSLAACGPRVGTGWASDPPRLRVDILKRRGPPLVTPLWLPAWNPRLRALLAAGSADQSAADAGATVLPWPPAGQLSAPDFPCVACAPSSLSPQIRRTMT